jgi:hypothetical protein
MKACPACNEMFVDEMNFCDVDGSPLRGDAATEAAAKNKLWSVLGVVLLIGALVLSLAVVLMPKPRPALPEVTAPVTASVPESSSPESAAPAAAVPAAESETSAAALRASELKAREREIEGSRTGLTEPAPNPKAAAIDSATPAVKPVQATDTAEPPTAAKPETGRTAKPVEADAESVKTNGSADSREAKKAQPDQPDPKAAGKDSKKKTDDKDKKKGGFFKVFKKIFGKE